MPPRTNTTIPGLLPSHHAQKRLQRWYLSLPLPIRKLASMGPSAWMALFLGSVMVFFFLLYVSGSPDEAAGIKHGWLDSRDTGSGSGSAQQVLPGKDMFDPKTINIFSEDGLVRTGREAYRHPVGEIIERAEAAWNREKTLAPKSPLQYVMQYRLANQNREPPISLDKWFDTQSRLPPLPPDSLLHFTPVPHALTRRAQIAMQTQPDTFTLMIRDGKVTTGLGINHDPALNDRLQKEEANHVRDRANSTLSVVKRFVQNLPDMRVTISALDHPRQSLRSTTLNALDQHFNANTTLGLADAAMDPSPSKFGASCNARTPKSSEHIPGLTFIHSTAEALNPCRHTWLQRMHPQTWGTTAQGAPGPVFGFVGGVGSTDVVLPLPLIEEDPYDTAIQGKGRTVAWERKVNKLYWRGPAPALDWQHPIYDLMKEVVPLIELMVAKGRGFLLQKPERALADLLDVEFVEFVPSETETEKLFKYVLDIDIDGASHRLHELLLTGSLVFRSGLFRTWMSDNAKPWVHYIPVMPDLSDLPALIHYFRTNGGVARKIAEAGRSWAESRLRRDDIDGAWYTALAEYGRMVSS